jgi:hypothetical protein
VEEYFIMKSHRMLFYCLGFMGGLLIFHSPIWPQDSPPDIWRDFQTVQRTIPDIPSASAHPGNIYLAGEEVIVHASPIIPDDTDRWRLSDDRGAIVKQGKLRLKKKSTPQ